MNAPLTQTTGRRKEAVARVQLRPGGGEITIDGKPLGGYFPTAAFQTVVAEPLVVTESRDAYDVTASVQGGGVSGQADALRMAIARSLADLNPEFRSTLKKAGLLTRDPRKKESKKYGLKKARKAPQFTKR